MSALGFLRGQSTRPAAVAGMANFIPANYRRSRAALARVRANAGDAIIACVGDSNTRGTGSHLKGNKGADLATNLQGRSGFPAKLAAQLNAAGFKAQSDNFFCSGGQSANYAAYDSRLVINGVTVNDLGGLTSVGGGMFAFTKAGDSVSFTTASPALVADIFFLLLSSNPSSALRWSVDGGATTNFSTYNVTSQASRLNIALGANTTHTILIEWVAGTSYLVGIDAWDNTTSVAHVWNMGWHGSRSGQWANIGAAYYYPQQIMAYLKPDLIVGPILAVNDYSTTNNVPVETFKANMQALIASWSAQSDILLVAPGPRADALAPDQSVIDQYRSAFDALAFGNGLAQLDEYAAMGPFAAAQTLGLYSTADNIHLTAAGAQARARMIAHAFSAIV